MNIWNAVYYACARSEKEEEMQEGNRQYFRCRREAPGEWEFCQPFRTTPSKPKASP